MSRSDLRYYDRRKHCVCAITLFDLLSACPFQKGMMTKDAHMEWMNEEVSLFALLLSPLKTLLDKGISSEKSSGNEAHHFVARLIPSPTGDDGWIVEKKEEEEKTVNAKLMI